MKQYNFVGDGAGSFEKEEVVQHVGCRLRTCTIALLTLLFLLGAAWLLDQLLTRQPGAHHPDPKSVKSQYACTEGAGQAKWSADQQEWCCRNRSVGCASNTTQAAVQLMHSTTRLPSLNTKAYNGQPFDCNAAYNNWKAAWSAKKKDFCCKVHQRGCPKAPHGSSTTSFAFNCDAGFSNWRKGWSIFKKDWCCKHVNRGCQ
mmetsp:Transcript_40198/g.124091  ORF Transcript_40198/g.124091 Transcript_40198/m.124091 type:complete len:201 (+) Transcript_40198:90-692(+)